MAEIVVSEFMDETVAREAFAGRTLLFDPGLVDEPERLAAALGDARALIVRNRTQVRGALLEHAPKLVVVGRLGVGLDNIDVDACSARGVHVAPATGANDLSVAEYVVAAAMLLLRGAFAAGGEVAAGAWPRQRLIGREISGKRLGLIGFGAIARETAARARALGMQVGAYDPYLPPTDERWGATAILALEDLLKTSDVVSLHTPLTSETKGLLDAQAIGLMKERAILVNAARGGVIDEAALADALRAGRLGGAALDVFEEEPLSAERGARFAGLENMVLTPHIAGVTEESNERVSRVTVQNVLEALGE